MDEHTLSAGSPAPSPAKGKAITNNKKTIAGKGFPRKSIRKTIAKRAPRGKGRGRNKTYEHPRVQAAYERQKELRELYSDVASAVKPALEMLADKTLNQMIENPTAHEQVPEFEVLQSELDGKLNDALMRAEQESTARNSMVETQSELFSALAQKRYENSFDYATDEFYDGVLNRLSILAELRREGAGIEIPDYHYQYVEESDEVAKNQGPYVMFRNGIEVPYPHRLLESKSSAVRTTLGRKPRLIPKRKADDLPEGQPDSKKHIGSSTSNTSGHARSGVARDDIDHKLDAGGDASTPRPRHIGGLLSAETEHEGDAESNAPSPTPLEEGLSPASDQKAEARSKKDVPDLPGGASEPDPWGVRTVFRRGPKANNRLILPSLYEFDEDEIGFRDSTNDPTRKATRNTRGKYLNKPNSRYWHLDSTIVNNNCTEYEDDELDPELVKRHKLHPKYGFFLPDSVNEAEPAGEHVDGTTPIVILTPNGSTLHASRSVRVKVMDEALESDRRKNRMSAMLKQFVLASDMTVDDITTEEMRERDREARERLVSESEDEDQNDSEDLSEEGRGPEPSSRFDSKPDNYFQLLLNAVARLEEEYEQEKEKERVQPSPSLRRASRPYDAVRDIFAGSDAPLPAVPPAAIVDTFGLSLLADVSEKPETYRRQSEAEYAENGSLIDPRLFDGPRPAASSSSNAFLQTALNPTPAFAHIAPAPPQAMDNQQQSSVSRNPFTNPNQGSTKGSPVLPPLRPGRREKTGAATGVSPIERQPSPQPTGPPGIITAPTPPPPAPQEFDSPRGMMQTNTGSFYPPAPPRPFHHSFQVHEPAAMMPMSLQHGPAMSGPPMMQMHSQPPLPAQPTVPYPSTSPAMSPPMPLAPMPPRMGLSPPLPPQGQQGLPGPPMMPNSANSPTTSNSRNRSSVPPNGQSQNSGKYRKIAAAPIPHNRPWAPNGGPELRLSNYDPRGAIKDYAANEPPPRSGPTTIRGWSVNNHSKSRHRKKEGSAEETESPK